MPRWGTLLAWLAGLVLLTSNARAEAPARAIWIWEPDAYAMLEHPARADAAFAFFASKRISMLYLYADAWKTRNLIVQRPEWYRRLIKRAHAQGIQVHALLGSADLRTELYILPQLHGRARAMVQRVLDYNAAAAVNERFDGINLDIEPHLLDEWPAQQASLLAGFLEMSESIMEAKRKSGDKLAIGPAIPFWWDGIDIEWQGKRQVMSQVVQSMYDYVAIMDYRDHAHGPDGIIRHAEDELQFAERKGATVMIGVETTPNEIQKVSFDHLAEADMERELRAAAEHFKRYRSFGGFVIHHYSGYQRWLKRSRAARE